MRVNPKWYEIGPEEADIKAVAANRRPDGISENDWDGCAQSVRDFVWEMQRIRTKRYR